MSRSARPRRPFQPGLEGLSERITPTLYNPVATAALSPGLVMPVSEPQPTDYLVSINMPAVCPTECSACASTAVGLTE